ncbi:MAG TPA: monofunctional biosynthetic peptidoglycan transglycosylase [Vicinamibacterales bacterium]|nr:monofunctional biosynthetic peptidoglycan transglycosylase [Vicinamibacterales bacterium]
MRKLARGIAALLATMYALGAYVWLTTPDVRSLRTENPRTTAFIDLRARQAQLAGVEPKRVQQWVGYNRISPHLVRAVLVTEDAAFWAHAGLDYQQIRESLEVNLERREFARGASTITQQLAKNLYLSPSKNPVRKLRELLIARRLEAELSKQRILELYLNVIEWGDGIYGAEAAARTYFRKPAAQLSQPEAALLAAAIANPRVMNPGSPTARLRRRQQMVMRRMGYVEPPPVVVAAPPATLPGEEVPAPAPDGAPAPAIEPVPPLPVPAGPPAMLPGQPVPPPKKPGGGGEEGDLGGIRDFLLTLTLS